MAPFTLEFRILKKIDLSNLAASMSYIGGAIKMMQVNRTMIHSGHVSHQTIELNEYAHILRSVDVIAKTATDLEMRAVLASSTRAQQQLERQFRQHGHYGAEALGVLIDPLHQLLATAIDEVQHVAAFGLAGKSASLMGSTEPPFGRAVQQTFPKIEDDIVEARLCLALDRATACVFHLMRAMEAAVQRLAEQLGISNVEREWGKLLSDMSRKIEAMPKGRQRDAWSENHSLLYHVKQAWRNDVMHPRRSYSTQDARRIYDAVESYLAQLSELLANFPESPAAAKASMG